MREPLRLTLVTPPAELPVALGEAKAHLRLDEDQTGEDALIMGYLRAAAAACEAFTARALITQTWTLQRDAWPGAPGDENLREGLHEGIEALGMARFLALPKAPLQSVVHVKTFDENDAETVWPAANYIVDTASEPGRVVARTGLTFPTPARAANGIEVQFTAGYGSNPADVPQALRQGILHMAATLFEQRGDAAPDGALHGSGALWQPFRLVEL